MNSNDTQFIERRFNAWRPVVDVFSTRMQAQAEHDANFRRGRMKAQAPSSGGVAVAAERVRPGAPLLF